MKIFRIFLFVLIMLLLITRTVSAQSDSPGLPVEVPKLTADILFSLTGSLLSVLAFVIPPFRRFQEKLGEWTPAFMAGSLFVVAVIYQLIWCQYALACVLANWQAVVLVWGTSFAANAGAYKAFVAPAKSRELDTQRVNANTYLGWPK